MVRTRADFQLNSVPLRLSRSVPSTDAPRLRFCAGSGHFGGIFGIKPPRGILSSDWPCGPWTYLVVHTRAAFQFDSVPPRLSRSVPSTDPLRPRFCAGSGHFGGIFGIKPPRGILSSDWPCGLLTYLVVCTRADFQLDSVSSRLSRSALSTDPPRLRFCAGLGHFGGIFGIKPPRGI